MNRETAQLRAALLRELRAFFGSNGFLEVETPRLSPSLIPEAHLEVFRTEYLRAGGSVPLYLVPSPELWLKQLIPRGFGSIFEIGKCFRNDEQLGASHNPEFTMLEWYLLQADYRDSLALFERLLAHLCAALREQPGAQPEALCCASRPVERIPVRDAVQAATGVDLAAHENAASLRRAASRAGIATGAQDDWNTVFDRLMVDGVEPSLPTDRPVALIDYPARVATLAGQRPSGGEPASPTQGYRTAERWELYLAGQELVNCYSEETDQARIAEFFEHEQKKKHQLGRTVHPVPPEFVHAFTEEYPRCSGGALGVDRLLMAFSGRKRINEVIFFPLSDILPPR